MSKQQYIKTKVSRIVEWYNAVESSTEKCEKDMLATEKTTIDTQIQPLITTMTWDKYDKEYIEETFTLVKEFYDRVMKAQANVQKIMASINAWGESPLFTRKDNSTDALLDIANRGAIVAFRLRKSLQTNRQIEKIMQDENYRLYFNVSPSCPCSSGSEESGEDEDEDNDARRKSGTASQRQQTMSESLGDLNRLREAFSTTVVFTEENAALYKPYCDYVDELVGKAVMAAIHTRFLYWLCLMNQFN